MKRLCSKVMLIAAAAIAFLACQKSEIEAPKFVEVNGLSFSSEKPVFDAETKTEWTGNTIQWSKGDKIRVAYTCDGVWQNAEGTSESSEENGSKTAKLYESKAITEAGSTASFSVPGSFKGTDEGVYEFYGIYPSSLVSGADIKYAPSVTITIPTTQTPTASSFDSAADVMASKSDSYVGIPKDGENNGTVSLKWERLSAHGHFTLKNLAVVGEENIQTITLTANADADMVGTHYLYLDTYNVVKPNSNAAPNSITIDARNLSIDSEGNVTFWASFLPCTWTSIDVKAETDKAIYTRSIDLTVNKKTFAQNARNTLGINMASAVREAKTALSLPFVRDFSGRSGSSGITELDGFSSIDGKVYNADNAIRLASVDSNGSITTQPLDLSQNFHVIVTACGWTSGELKMTVSAGDQANNITLTTYGADQKPGTWTDYVINFDPVGSIGTVQFSAVKNFRYFIQKIQILEGHAPVLSATNPSEMKAAGGNGSFTYTLSNPKDGKTVSATENSDWIENLAVNQEAKTVSYKVAENTSEESRTATITLSYEGAESVNVTVSQAGKSAEGEETEPVWTLVTDASTLAVGDKIIIAAKDFSVALSTTQNDNNRGEAEVTKSASTLTLTSDVQEITLEDGIVPDTFGFNVGTKYLYAPSSSSNNLKSGNLNENASWAITIESSGAATIVAKGSSTRNMIQYNSTSKLFSCYEVSKPQKAVVIYRLEGGESPEPDSGAESVTVSNTIKQIADSNGWENGTKYGSFSLDDIITATVPERGNSGKFYTTGNEWRIYQTENPTLTITAAEGYTIETVKITYNISNTGVLTLNASNITSGTIVSVNAASVEFGVGNTVSAINGQVKVTGIEVVYHADN